MNVQENYLEKEVQEKIQHLLFSPLMSWTYQADSAHLGSKDKYKEVYGVDMMYQTPSFGCVIVRDGLINVKEPRLKQVIRGLMPLISMNKKKYGLDPNSLQRIRLGLHLPTVNKPLHNNPHIDSQDPHVVVLYYVNDVDGDTFFFDEDMNITNRVSPKMGKAVMFDGFIRHSSSIPTTGTRITVNFNYDKKITEVL